MSGIYQSIVRSAHPTGGEIPASGEWLFYSIGTQAYIMFSDGIPIALAITGESIQDIVGAMTVAGTGITVTYDDPSNTLTIALDGATIATLATVAPHIANTSNPHAVTKAQVGLGNADNTSDANKPISTATQTALNLKYDASNPNGYETPSQLNTRDTNNRNRANHTGTQLASTIGLLTGLAAGSDQAIAATDTLLQALANLQAQIDASSAQDWTELCCSNTYNNSSTVTGVNVSELAVSVVSGRKYYYEATLLYETATTGTGIGVTMTSPDGASAPGALLVQMPTSAGDGTGFMYGGTINSLGDYVTSPNTQAGRHIINMKGCFVADASGTFNITFRSESGGNTVSILPGSTVLMRDFG